MTSRSSICAFWLWPSGKDYHRQSGLEVRPSQKNVPVKCFKEDGTLKRPVQVGTIPKIR